MHLGSRARISYAGSVKPIGSAWRETSKLVVILVLPPREFIDV